MRSSFQADKVGISYQAPQVRLLSNPIIHTQKTTLRRISAEGKILKPKA